MFGNLPDIKPKRKVKRWVNLYTSGEWELYDSKEKARNFLSINPSKSVAVAVEIGPALQSGEHAGGEGPVTPLRIFEARFGAGRGGRHGRHVAQ